MPTNGRDKVIQCYHIPGEHGREKEREEWAGGVDEQCCQVEGGERGENNTVTRHNIIFAWCTPRELNRGSVPAGGGRGEG